MPDGFAPRLGFAPGARNPKPLGMREHRVEFVFFELPVKPSKFDRNIIEAAGGETAIEMPQPRNDHSDDRHFDVRPRLIEDEEVQALTLGNPDAGGHLLIRFETAEL